VDKVTVRGVSLRLPTPPYITLILRGRQSLKSVCPESVGSILRLGCDADFENLVLVWVDVPVWILVGIAVGGVDFAQGGVFFDFYEDGEEASGVGAAVVVGDRPWDYLLRVVVETVLVPAYYHLREGIEGSDLVMRL
jgi:hypothetical protein